MSDKTNSYVNQYRTVHIRSYNYPGGGTIDASYVRNFPWTDFRLGSEDPTWKSKVATHVDATGSLVAERHQHIYRLCGSISAERRASSWDPSWSEKYTVSGMVADPVVYTFSAGDFASVFITADNKALVNLHKDIQKETTSFSGGTFLGELRETIKMIRRPAAAFRDSLTRYMNDVRDTVKYKVRVTNRYNKAKEIQKILSGLWLEYSYGWKPLVNDIKDLASVFAHDNEDSRHSHARGHGYLEKVSSAFTSDPSYGDGTIQVRNSNTGVIQCRVIYRAGLTFTGAAPFGSFARLVELAGFRWGEFVPTIWNLLPYSFVVDYFSNIGDVLQCTATDRANVSWVNRTVLYSNIYTSISKLDVKAGDAYVYDLPMVRTGGTDLGYCTSVFTRVERSSSTLRYPTIEFRMPAVDSAKWINIAALIVQGKVTSKGLAQL